VVIQYFRLNKAHNMNGYIEDMSINHDMGVTSPGKDRGEPINWLMQPDSGFSHIKTRSEFFDNETLKFWYITAHSANNEDQKESVVEANRTLLRQWGLNSDRIFEFYHSLENDISRLSEK